ncbi:hypothetical protein JYU34_021665 [Plutella xylostella]|uniref:Fatty acyl-CoA reductase n=1 Tax=Plutella xylostella TaxID=51655 RepID=A0ABQ7PR72_PLUXY|nr:hypothetical protein JYU34_021665 [Plutella xylostella]
MDPALALDVKILSQLRSVRAAEERGDSDIQRLYEGAVVFITGGTGFLGKQLVEKLLRACRGIKKVYLLSRSKKGKSMAERLKTTLEDPVFNEVRKVDPEFEKRIQPVEGDIMELRLGLSDKDWETLASEVNFIFHEAATVRFDEPIKVAIITNVRGTRECLALARDCRSLKAFVYVSTAYSNCNKVWV